jgi:hypothetical protein
MTPKGGYAMSTQTNRHIVRRVLEEFWQSYADNPAVVDELFAGDYVNHDLSTPAVRGLEAFKQWVGAVRTSWAKGFPDYRITIEDLTVDISRHQHRRIHGNGPNRKASDDEGGYDLLLRWRQGQGNMVELRLCRLDATTRWQINVIGT